MSTQPLTPDTPAKSHSIHSASGRTGSLVEKRTSVVEDANQEVCYVNVDQFMLALLPRLPPALEGTKAGGAVDSVLKKSKAWSAIRTQLKEKPEKTEHEDKIFANLTTLFNEIVVAASKSSGIEPNFEYVSQPHVPPTSEKHPDFRPDGVVSVKGSKNGNRISYYDIAVTAEFKKRSASTDKDDNATKMIYAMQHIMSVDPCRRCVYGLTVEKAEMRLSFLSRAMLVVTKPFDFIDNRMKFAMILLSFAFADKAQMGWDLSVTPSVNEQSERAYSFKMGSTSYQTKEELMVRGADGLVCRGARVYRVNDGDKDAALKDIWLEEDRKTERELYNEIIRDIKKIFPEQAAKAEKHLMTPINDEFVKVDGVEDHTKLVMMHGAELDFEKGVPLVAPKDKTNHSQQSTSFPISADLKSSSSHAVTQPNMERATIHHRRHYRVVFKEFAIPLYKVKDLGKAYRALADVVELLRLMHGAGWAHRDISVGNIYFFEGRGLLGDLEYAKKSDDKSGHPFRTGTADFMAAEAMALDYLFLPFPASRPRPPFRHNALHDIESAWWCGLWTLFFNRPETYKESQEQSADRYIVTVRIFPGNMDADHRLGLLVNPLSILDALEKTAWHLEYEKGSFAVVVVAPEIVKAYRTFEQQLLEETVQFPATDEISKLLGKTFEDAAIDFEGVKVASVKKLAEPKRGALKRPWQEEEAE